MHDTAYEITTQTVRPADYPAYLPAPEGRVMLPSAPKLMDERMGHMDGSVQARYTHITRQMREGLMAGLTAEWEGALDARLAMCPTSPVNALNDLLQERLTARR